MSRIAGSERDLAWWRARRGVVPVASTLAATLIDTLPIVIQTPLIPEFAFLVLIAWRLLRPGLWQASVALPLGLFNDIVTGHPIGQSMVIWTVIFLFLDLIDSRVGWRDYWLDWLFASVAILGNIAASWYIADLSGAAVRFEILLPQLALSVFSYPLVARLVLSLDHWRLAR